MSDQSKPDIWNTELDESTIRRLCLQFGMCGINEINAITIAVWKISQQLAEASAITAAGLTHLLGFEQTRKHLLGDTLAALSPQAIEACDRFASHLNVHLST